MSGVYSIRVTYKLNIPSALRCVMYVVLEARVWRVNKKFTIYNSQYVPAPVAVVFRNAGPFHIKKKNHFHAYFVDLRNDV